MGTISTMTYIITAAMAAVTTKVSRVVLMTLPARRTECMLAMAEETEQNTMGTTTQNIMLVNRAPRGSSAVAPGQAKPTMQPRTMPRIMVQRNQLFLKKFFMEMLLAAR